jgi:hypothetical protein
LRRRRMGPSSRSWTCRRSSSAPTLLPARRRPRRPHQASVLGRVQEFVGEKLGEVRVRRLPPVGRRRAAQHPEEAVVAAFQAVGNLARLRRSEEASAPEAEAGAARRAIARTRAASQGTARTRSPGQLDRSSGHGRRACTARRRLRQVPCRLRLQAAGGPQALGAARHREGQGALHVIEKGGGHWSSSAAAASLD